MLKISKSRFFNYYLPLALIAVLVLISGFVYYASREKGAPMAEAAWYSGSWGYRKPITIDRTKIAPNSEKVTFSTATSTASWTVPTGVISITVKAWGGGGGGTANADGSAGGGGGFAQATISVTPGESLTVGVGGGGGVGSSNDGGGGGGWSGIKRSSTFLVVAGGGGGGGGKSTWFSSAGGAGGAGGGSSGVAGTTIAGTNFGGGGGTSSAGGTGGASYSQSGSSGQGGAGGGGGSYSGGGGTAGVNGGAAGGDIYAYAGGGGGGGGGYYGGGGGGGDTSQFGYAGGGGGGGSGYATGTATTLTAGSGTTPGNTGDADYTGSIGAGGTADNNGNTGYVVITYTSETTLSNFPMLFSVTDTDLKYTGSGGKVEKTDGTDILFTSADGVTKLDHELEKYASTTGETIAWVEIPTLTNTSDVLIYIYFGNSGAADQQNKTGVWDSNYKGVYHLPNGTTLSGADSTNANNGTLQGSPSATAGKINGAGSFNGSSQDVSLGNNTLDITSSLTLEAWVNVQAFPTAGNWGYIIGKGYDGTKESYYLRLTGTGGLLEFGTFNSPTNVSSQWTISGWSTSSWHYIVGVYDGTNWKLYFDGTAVGSPATGLAPQSTTKNAYIAATDINGSVSRYFNGYVDEARISNTTRSVIWIATQFNNQSSPSTFYSYGALGAQTRVPAGVAVVSRGAGSSWYSSSWGYRKQINVDKSKVSATLTNFPMLFSVTDSDLKYTGSGGKVGKTDGTDILFTASDGITKLDHELEKYASTTGETIAWVEIPTLSSTTDTSIYIYFGNSGAADQQNKTGVWDSSYRMVHHLPNGTTLSATDSTSNGFNGSINGATAGTGQIDGAGSFASASSQYVSTSATSTAAFTWEAWFKTSSIDTNYQTIMAIGNTNYILFDIQNGAGSFWSSDGLEGGTLGVTGLVAGQWYHIVFVRTGNSTTGGYKAYLNGSAASTGNTGTWSSTDVIWLGGRQNQAGQYFNGSLDEMRVSTTERTAGWIATEYNNQSSPSTFYSKGALEAQTRQTSGGSAAPAVKIRGGVKFK